MEIDDIVMSELRVRSGKSCHTIEAERGREEEREREIAVRIKAREKIQRSG